MFRPGIAPSATDPKEELADWLEYNALFAADRDMSIADLGSVLTSTGSVDALDDRAGSVADEGNERDVAYAIAEAAFEEIESRAVACGGIPDRYPFLIGNSFISLADHSLQSIYTFLLLLSASVAGTQSRQQAGIRLFEQLSATVAENYFGGPHPHVSSRAFGFPRENFAKHFPPAIDQLCVDLREGGGYRTRPRGDEQKDAKLDIVAWRWFPDGREGKLIGFGQCATGANWREKLTELQPKEVCEYWLLDAVTMRPVKMFFTPFRVEQDLWKESTTFGGIIFDRCRVALYAPASGDLFDRCVSWTDEVLRKAAA